MEILIVAVMATVNMGIVAGISITMYLKGMGAAERMVKYAMGAQESLSAAAASIPQGEPFHEQEPITTMEEGWAEWNRKKEELLSERPDLADKIEKMEADIRDRRTPAMAEGMYGSGS